MRPHLSRMREKGSPSNDTAIHRVRQVHHASWNLIRVRFSGKMKRSPLNNAAHSVRPYGARHSSYNWKSPENASGRGYQLVEGKSYQRFPVGAGSQPCDDNFIPLNVSTPMTRNEKYATNRYSPAGSVGGWHNNYKDNYYVTSRAANCSNRYLAYKHSPKPFHRQKRKGYKGIHRQVNVSAYIDINSFLEDPWEDLLKKLNDLKNTNKSKGSQNEFLFNSKQAENDSTERFGSKLSKDTNLDDSQCSQEYKNECSVDTSFEMQNTDFNQISKVCSLVKSEIGDVCPSQDLLNENVNNKICGASQEKNIHSNVSLIDVDQKNI